MKKRTVPFWLWYVLAALLVLADQEVKLWVRNTLSVGETRSFLPHFIELLHVENTGAAFSIFSQHTWMLTVLSAAVSLALILALWRDWVTTNSFSRLCVTLVLAGAVGNLIDRVAFGKVTDMFNFTFMRFGVFNVADVCVVAGVLGYAVYSLLPRSGKTEGDEHEADADGSH